MQMQDDLRERRRFICTFLQGDRYRFPRHLRCLEETGFCY